MLEQAGRVPTRKFLRSQVGDLRADAVLGLRFAQREIELDAMHALGFELERGARVSSQRAASELFVDGGAGGCEFTVVDVRDDIVQQDVMFARLRSVVGPARHAEQQRRQQQATERRS